MKRYTIEDMRRLARKRVKRTNRSKAQRKKFWIQFGRNRVQRNPSDRPTIKTSAYKYGWPPDSEYRKGGCFPEGLNYYCKLIGANPANEYKNNKEILLILKAWVLKNKRVPHAYEFDKDPNLPCSRVISKRFNGWDNVIKKAIGIKLYKKFFKGQVEKKGQKWIKIGRERIKKNPDDRPEQTKLGYKHGWPPAHEFRKGGCFPVGLNNYCKLIEASTSHERLTDAELLAVIRKWTIEHNIAPRTYNFDQDPNLPCSRTISERLGGWEKAREKALGKNIDKYMEGYRFWRRWQRLCGHIAEKLYGHIIYDRKIAGIIGRVDIYVPCKNLVIDAMTSAYKHFHKESEIGRYIGTENNLEFWCLDEGGHEYYHPKLKYVFVDDLVKRLKRKRLTKEIIELKRFSRLQSGDFTPEELHILLKRIYKEKGKPLNTRDIENSSIPCPNVEIFIKVLGNGESFKKACEASHIPYKNSPFKSPFNRRHSRSQLLNVLRELVDSDVPSIVDALLAGPGLPSPSTYQRHFGKSGITKALKIIGINKTLGMSNKELIIRLRAACKKYGGAIPFKKCGPKLGISSYKTYIFRFGSYDNALELAGYPRKIVRYNKGIILDELIRYKNEFGEWASAPKIDSKKGYPSAGTVKRYFNGSFKKAVHAAKINFVSSKQLEVDLFRKAS